MINVKNNFLVILVATYNRLELLKKTLNSIKAQTKTSHQVVVIDGGSTDGTIEYLKSDKSITVVLQNKLLGTSRCYNEVWKNIECKYTCWLSDDTEVINNSLDVAISILEVEDDIGMVGLKMKDTIGPWMKRPYMGFISEYGIINCNHGVLPYELIKKVGFFNQDYRSYMIDPDLTASILSLGKKVVLTKNISVLHHREWADNHDWLDKMEQEKGNINNLKIYLKKFCFLETKHSKVKTLLKIIIYKVIRRIYNLTLNSKIYLFDFTNMWHSSFISLLDFSNNKNKQYYLVQQLPKKIVSENNNPYKNDIFKQIY